MALTDATAGSWRWCTTGKQALEENTDGTDPQLLLNLQLLDVCNAT